MAASTCWCTPLPAFSGLTPLESLPPEDWLRSLQVNLNAPFVLTQSCLPLLRAARGSCVFVLDDEARVGNAFWNAYGVAKFALRGLVSQWSQELENSGVRVLAFTPVPMRTTLRARAYFAEDAARLPTPEAEAARCLALIAQRPPAIERVALCSDQGLGTPPDVVKKLFQVSKLQNCHRALLNFG